MIILDGILFRRNKKINQKTILLPVAFQKYYCKIVFNVINIANYDIIFEIFWLKKYKSRIDWKQKIIRLKYNYIIDLIFLYQLNTVEDEEKNKKLSEENTTSNLQNKYFKKQNSNIITIRIGQPEQKASIK